MLRVTIPGTEQYDSERNLFTKTKDTELVLEHSLVSVSKWESKWKRSYANHGPANYEETADYIRCMTITQHVDPNVYNAIPADILLKINEYINDPMTATIIHEVNGPIEGKAKDIVTSELIYYWMFANSIPLDCQKWHLNRLMTLIRVFAAHNGPDTKISADVARKTNRARNAARRAKYHSKG